MDIASIRSQMGMRANELARDLGISAGHMADLESGRRHLTLPLAAKLEALSGRHDIVAEVVRQKTNPSATQAA